MLRPWEGVHWLTHHLMPTEGNLASQSTWGLSWAPSLGSPLRRVFAHLYVLPPGLQAFPTVERTILTLAT